MSDSRVIVLLGAGASADAGLPLTRDLAGRIVQDANSGTGWRGETSWVQALNFTYGSMVGYRSDDGGNPLEAVSIERLISALRLLRYRSTHEAAPFVASWKPGAGGFGAPTKDPFSGPNAAAKLRKAIAPNLTGAGGSDRDIEEAVTTMVRAAIAGASPEIFAVVENNVLMGLKKELGSPQTVGYLRPLVDLAKSQVGGLDVLTLNYDVTVETMAKSVPGLRLDTGIERWKPGVRLRFESEAGRLNLLKLHGSLDWVRDRYARSSGVYAPRIEQGSATDAAAPWIVVGDREKLATDGPTLALLRCAEDALERAAHLVVVGYSFSDDHINAMIRDWMLGDEARTMNVLDPSWSSFIGAGGDAREGLLDVYGPRKQGKPINAESPRMLPIPLGTAAGLEEALRVRPAPDPVPHISARLTTGGLGRIGVTFRNEGRDFLRFSIGASQYQPQGSGVLLYIDEDERDSKQDDGLHFEQRPAPVFEPFRRGQSVTVYPIVDESAETLTLSAHATSPTGEKRFKFTFDLRNGVVEALDSGTGQTVR